MIHEGDEIHLDAGQRFCVINVVLFNDEMSRRSRGCCRSRRRRRDGGSGLVLRRFALNGRPHTA